MDKDVYWGKKSLRFWYLRYKDSPYYLLGWIVLSFITCFILATYFVLPQLQSWFSIREEVIKTRERITNINNNITYMSSLDRSVLNSQLEVAVTALPTEKNFDAILNAVSDASLESGVSLGDFVFQVGEVASPSAQPVSANTAGLSTTRVSITVTGNPARVQRFLQELQENLPLSEVMSLEGNQQSATLNVQFYQKPLAPYALKADEPIVPVSAENAVTLERLSTWETLLLPVNGTSTGTNSAIPLF